jgi:hypothetical protein
MPNPNEKSRLSTGRNRDDSSTFSIEEKPLNDRESQQGCTKKKWLLAAVIATALGVGSYYFFTLR